MQLRCMVRSSIVVVYTAAPCVSADVDHMTWRTTMGSELSNSAARVQAVLTAAGYTFEVTELPDSTRTAKEAAASIGCSVAQIAKSLVFKNDAGDPVLVVASGVNRVDTAKVAAATGTALHKADADFVKARVGFAIGGIPPVGHSTALPTYLDRDLQQHEVIWAAAGSPFAVFRLTPTELGTLTGGRWLELRSG